VPWKSPKQHDFNTITDEGINYLEFVVYLSKIAASRSIPKIVIVYCENGNHVPAANNRK